MRDWAVDNQLPRFEEGRSWREARYKAKTMESSTKYIAGIDGVPWRMRVMRLFLSE